MVAYKNVGVHKAFHIKETNKWAECNNDYGFLFVFDLFEALQLLLVLRILKIWNKLLHVGCMWCFVFLVFPITLMIYATNNVGEQKLYRNSGFQICKINIRVQIKQIEKQTYICKEILA